MPLCSGLYFMTCQSCHLPENSFEITDGVFQVLNVNSKTPYILKIANRPLYKPYDTELIREELKNLEMFRGTPNIVRAAGIAVSANPYMTSNTRDQPLIVTGIVPEFYGGGSIQRALNIHHPLEYSWKRWPKPIATALGRFHMAGKTHMDLKPSNIVLDADGNAVLIDISGIGGITQGWRAPEIRDGISLSEFPYEVRKSNDTWAYGKFLSELILHVEDSPTAKTLKRIAGCLMVENVHARMTLFEAISELELSGIDNIEGSCKEGRSN
ncbi:hypothetical protein CISG_03750 [Coccidioides immitis RMSCC 3703]|uniref:Protein kinase domain-containing protein n=1 Tax=Coccidioides immitis RMSCC 3703 TaxID=454286 RepID=A0A0J8QMX9_COCIT|nr:hypothetical protein CISG_03750 [Coccidioides immitis RMSCC 3703]